MSRQRLSKLVSHALRHEPWLYELELDAEGWVPMDALLTAIHEQGSEWTAIDRDALEDMIATSDKKRHEIDGDRIRALYGHSVPGRIERTRATPPDRLFHGTSPAAWKAIQHDGLHPMSRQYVHLSADVTTAEQVGRRKAPDPIVLAVDARRAHHDGHRFWHGNQLIWLAEHIPAQYLHELRRGRSRRAGTPGSASGSAR